MLSLLAVNTTYRGPATPGTAAALAYGFAVPDENALLVKKLRGGIGALTSHLCEVFTSSGGELRLRSKVDEILVADGRVAGVRLEDGSTIARPIVVSGVAPDLTVNRLVDPNALPADIRERFSRIDHRGSYLQMHFALDGIPEFAAPYEVLNDPGHAIQHRDLQHSRGIAAAVGGLPARHRARRPGDRAADPVGQRPRPGSAGQACGVGVLAVVSGRGHAVQLRRDEGRDGTAGDRQDHQAGTRTSTT